MVSKNFLTDKELVHTFKSLEFYFAKKESWKLVATLNKIKYPQIIGLWRRYKLQQKVRVRSTKWVQGVSKSLWKILEFTRHMNVVKCNADSLI